MSEQAEGGFTLIELMVAMAIVGMVGALMATAFSSYQASFTKQNQIAAMVQDVGGGFYLMEREIRLAGFDPTHDAGAGVTVAANRTITFTADISGDGTLNGTEQITYSLLSIDADRTDLVRQTGAAGAPIETVARYITDLDFGYLDSDGNPTAVIEDIEIVTMELEGRTQRENLDRTKRLASRVNVRNAGL